MTRRLDSLDHVCFCAAEDVCDVGIGGRLALDKARLATLVGAIQIDAL